MRKMKQIGAFCLAAVLASAGSGTVYAGSPEFARTAEEWAGLQDNIMEYGELADLIHEYNLTVQKNQLDISDKKKDGRITSDENAQYYRDAASDYRDAITGENPLSDAQNAVGASNADAQADNNVEDINVYQMGYDQEEANLVSSAQTSMISYFKQQYELESTKASLEYLQAVYDSAKAKLNLGTGTQIQVLSAKKDLQDANTSIEKLTASIEETRQNLCIMLGWNYNDTPQIQELPIIDQEKITSMNPEKDVEAALKNNYTLNINTRKLENASSDVTKETLKRTIMNNKQNISADLVKSYQSVLMAQSACEQAKAEMELEKKNLDTAERKYQNSIVSRLEYLKQMNTSNTKVIAVKTSELNLLEAVQNYENAVSGLASTGG
ncbi:TolC family protein [Lacrimispora sp. AGF001]|uniref:TolC family protein n=1 Tax=Lacrimispora sp. AGF001 TaxID=3401631 RepID=UPI003B43ACAF|nr:TolC family protein [Paenibacillaceae bacterium]